MSLATLGTGCVPRHMSSSSGSIVARTRAARARASVEGDAPEPEPEEPPRKLSKKRIREVFQAGERIAQFKEKRRVLVEKPYAVLYPGGGERPLGFYVRTLLLGKPQ